MSPLPPGVALSLRSKLLNCQTTARRFSMRRSGINHMSSAITRTARAIHDERSVAMTATIYNAGDSLPFQSRPSASFNPPIACELLPAGGERHAHDQRASQNEQQQ